MGKIIDTLITTFSGGLSKDKRDGWSGGGSFFTTDKFALTKHFDTYTYPKKLFPYIKTEAVEDKTLDIVKFLNAKNSAGTERFYGYGIVAGSTKAAVYFLSSDTWTGLTNNESGTAGRNETVFFYYKDFIYMWRGNNLMRFDTTGSAAWADSYQSISYTDLAQPVHHPSDDIAYFFTDNKVHKLDNTTWTSNVLTLPSDLKIMHACPFGNYLAIACAPTASDGGKSVVFLWDRDSSLATLSDRIDFGEGFIQYIFNLNNKLIGIMDFFTTNTYGHSAGKVLIKQASGQFATQLNEIILDTTMSSGTVFQANSQVKDNKGYFVLKVTQNGDNRLGIWAVDEFGRATLDFVEEEATVGTPEYQGIYARGNGWYIAHSNDGSVNRTDDNTTRQYSTTLASVYESLVFSAGDPSKTKKLIVATVMTEAMPTAGQCVLKYRKNEETSFTTLFTHTTDNSISHSTINVESSGATLPEYKEIQFRIESTGGAAITGLKFRSEVVEKDIYN